MKKTIALLSVIILIFSLSAAAFAADTVYTEGTLYYTVTNDSATITGCFGKDAEVTVPAMIAGIPVNTIASGAFTSNSNIKKLNLPDTITVVQDGAIAPGIKVIYNANTSHPQETPTDLILAHTTPVETLPPDPVTTPEVTTAVVPPVGSGTAVPPETSSPVSGTSSPSVTTSAPEPATTPEAPVTTGIPIGGGDVNDDDTTAPAETSTPGEVTTATEETGSSAPQETTSPEPVSGEETSGAVSEPSESSPETTGDNSSTSDTPGKIWPWAVSGGVLVAGGAGTAAVIAGKKKKSGRNGK